MPTETPMKTLQPRRIPMLVEGAIAMMCVLCVLIALTHTNFRLLEDASRLNNHSYRVLEKISTLRLAIDQSESHLRGYSLTDEKEFLEESQRADSMAMSSLSELKDLTRDNLDQQTRIDRFNSLYNPWRQHLTVAVKGKADGARRTADFNSARRAEFTRLLTALDEVENSERALLLERTWLQEDSRRSAAMFLLFASFCAISFTLVFIVLLGLQIYSEQDSTSRLTTSRRQLQTVLENAPIVLYAVDANEKFTLMTGRGAETLGMDPKTVLGKNIVDVIGNDFDYAPLRAALAGHANVSRAELNGVVFETNRLPLIDTQGKTTGMIGVGLDVTGHVRAEKALRDSENRFRSVIESVQEVVFQVDAQGRWSFLNPAWRLALGHEVEASIGRPAMEFVLPEDHAEIITFFGASDGRRKEVRRNLIRFLTRSGTVRWMDVQVQLERDEDGVFAGAAGTLSDITDRKLAQEELLATTTLQKAILNSSNYSIIAVDASGVVGSFNRAAQDLLGYAAADVRGKKSILLFHDVEEIENRARELSEEMNRPVAPGFETLICKARGGAIDEREWIYRTRDGRRIPMRLSISELRGVEGEISGFVMVGYDLTESRRAESIKNEFVSVVSHELRTPLTSIRGALGLLAGGVAGPLPDNATQMIEIAQKNSDRLVLLINDILDIEKIENGEMRFESRSLVVLELLQNAVEQNQAYGEALGVKVLLDVAASQGDLHILGDEDRLQQVLSNLISNACKFTPSGGTVKVGATYSDGFARIWVTDQGPGVPPDFIPRLFEKFAQADSTSTRKQGGTGLGLAIARAIVEKHNGSIYYVAPSEGERGSCFAFTIPLATAVVPQNSQSMGRVLICEDDVEIGTLLSIMVSRSGYEPDIASTITEARAKLKVGGYIGLTLDLTFPDGNGLELLADIRANPKTRDLPVIVVSLNSRQGQLNGEAVDVLDWLCKPIDAGRLLATLSQFQRSDSPRVLHVEDDPDIRSIMAAILGVSAVMTPASTLGEARQRLAQAVESNTPFDLAILDTELPDGSGPDLIPLLSAAMPSIPIVMFSASETSEENAHRVAASLVKSRTTNEVLRQTIQRLLDSHTPKA